ncbi:MAG: hypothetical protein ABIO79_03700 [Ferruginibacter sp.]
MKKIFTLSAGFFLFVILLSSCAKERIAVNNDENYWLSKEEGDVVYSDPTCSYYVVATNNGYNIVRAYAGYKPYEGDLVYGNFSNLGTRDMYNYTARYVFAGTVTDYWLSYNAAMDALDYYCAVYGKAGETTTRVFKETTRIKK